MGSYRLQDNFPLLSFDQSWTVEKPGDPGGLAQQVTFDEFLLEKVSRGEIGPCIYINSTPRCLVTTVRESRMPNFEIARQTLATQGWPVVVRCTGGSCVPQGPGVINLAIIHPKVRGWSLEAGYLLLCDLLRRLLAEYGLHAENGEVPGSFCDGRYNLQVGGRKLVGTAQRWAGGSRESAAVLAHACLLVDLDLVEATEKINALYSMCDNPRRFSPDACTSLRECCGPLPEMSTNALTADVERRMLSLCKDFFNISD